jgi:hypothetical protein
MNYGMYSPNDDNISKVSPSDKENGKAIITLRHLNKLKKLRSYRQLEYLKNQEVISMMYAKPDDSDGQ